MVDSTHPIFAIFVAKNHMIVGNYRRGFGIMMHCHEASHNPVSCP